MILGWTDDTDTDLELRRASIGLTNAKRLGIRRVWILLIILGGILSIYMGIIFLAPIFTRLNNARTSENYEEIKKEAMNISRVHFLEVIDKHEHHERYSPNGGRWYYDFKSLILTLKECNQNRKEWRLKISTTEGIAITKINSWANDCNVGDRVRFIWSAPEFEINFPYSLEDFIVPIPQKIREKGTVK